MAAVPHSCTLQVWLPGICCCRWGETKSLNSGHQWAYVHPPEEKLVWRATVE
jgi:hypothetical protein